MGNNQNMTSKDKDGNILINGEFKVCNIPARCSGSRCYESCIINLMIQRLYELEHLYQVCMKNIENIQSCNAEKMGDKSYGCILAYTELEHKINELLCPAMYL